MFEEDCIHGSNGKEFIKKMLCASSICAEGYIDVEGIHEDHTKWGLAKLAMENPIAYVAESKSMIRDVLSILLNLPPDHFFQLWKVKQ